MVVLEGWLVSYERGSSVAGSEVGFGVLVTTQSPRNVDWTELHQQLEVT